jgi:hypothetical protein
MTAACWGNPRCFCRKVGYMSCVPCETHVIIVIMSTRYRKMRQWLTMPRPSADQVSCLVFSQTADSFTFMRTNTASSAGAPPMKNIARQPKCGKTKKYAQAASR